MSNDPIRRKQRWAAFYEEEGGIRDMIASIRAACFEGMSKAEPWQAHKFANLALAAKQAEHLNQTVLAIINDGKVAEAAKEHAEHVASLPDFKRRWL